MRLIKAFSIVLITLLSLNCFARQSEKLTAAQAKKETTQAQIDGLFIEIDTQAANGNCIAFIDELEFPKNYTPILTKLGYKVEFYKCTSPSCDKAEKISWCD